MKDFFKNSSPSAKAKRQFFLLWLGFFALAFVAVNAAGLSPTGVNELGASAMALAQGTGQSTGSVDTGSGNIAASAPSTVQDGLPAQAGESPIGLTIPSASLNANVVNAADTSAGTMDTDLLKGAVHYPGSANLGVNGTVYILGHSDGLPGIKNPNYKVFNSFKTLKAGETVVLNSATRSYTYSIDSVTLINSGNAVIDFSSSYPKLVLSTCNVWGAVEQRYVVVAHFVSSQAITTF